MFELDIIETKDGHYIAAHDWDMWSRFTGYQGELPVSKDEFVKHRIYGEYTTLTMERINAWFAAHPYTILITDKVNDPLKFAAQFIDKSRLIMELFSFMALEEASLNGIRGMISQDQLQAIPGDKLVYIQTNEIQYVAVSRRIIASNTRLFEQLRDEGIKVYVYNVNFDPGKDERYVQDNEIGLVYGMYADKWIFDQPKEELRR
jgi:glycerophosphoryl diester phosphodiesterase